MIKYVLKLCNCNDEFCISIFIVKITFVLSCIQSYSQMCIDSYSIYRIHKCVMHEVVTSIYRMHLFVTTIAFVMTISCSCGYECSDAFVNTNQYESMRICINIFILYIELMLYFLFF
jgi:hypothetical protein